MSDLRERTDRKTAVIKRGYRILLLIGSLTLPFLLCWEILGCERRPLPSEKPDETVVALVNGRALLKEDFDFTLPEDYERVLTAEEKEEYLNRWITTELLYRAAIDNGYRATRDIEVRLELQRKELVADRYLQDVIQERAVVSEEEVRAYYEAHEYEYTKEFRVSHILANTPEDAQEILDLLKKRSFSWVARRHSIDKHTGMGGDLGYLSRGNMIPEFEEVVFNMQEGEVSDVIESDFGYHIIKLTSIRNARNPVEYEDAKEGIASILMRKKRKTVYDNLVAELERHAVIEVLDAELEGAMSRTADTLESVP